MDKVNASILIQKLVGRPGTFMGMTNDGFRFGFGRENGVAMDGFVGYDGTVIYGGKTLKEPTAAAKAKVQDGGFKLAKIGEHDETVHLAADTGVVATACNPKKTSYASKGEVHFVDGNPEEVTCKVCGWIVEKRRKAGTL